MNSPEEIAEEILYGADRQHPDHYLSVQELIAEAITAERSVLAEKEAEIERMREAFEKCSELFSEIQGDWTDPRNESIEGQRIIGEALTARDNTK